MRRTPRTRAAWKAAAIALGAGLLMTACSSGSTTTSGSGASGGTTSAAASTPAAAPSPTSVLCQDAAALRTSLNNLTHITVNKGAADEIKTDLADVKQKLATLKADAKGEWQTQTASLQAELGKLQTATSDLTSNPSISTVSGVVTALGGVTSAASSLLAAISTKCPSASPSA